MQGTSDTLIITSGDISDADGFLALARYARTGADCMFVMNFPSYVRVPEDGGVETHAYEADHPGLGYRFSARDLLQRPADAWNCADMCRYEAFVARFRGGEEDDGAAMKRMMSELAAEMARAVWQEACGACGRLFYCVGGVNDVSLFSLEYVKNELREYSPLLPDEAVLPRCGAEEDAVFECAPGVPAARAGCVHDFAFGGYRRIVMDMNGSAAFMKGEAWQAAVKRASFRLQALYLMGGVRTDVPLQTMTAIPGVLNRLAGATTNQLYSPGGTKALLDLCAAKGVRVYVVSNNAVESVEASRDGPAKVEAMRAFLEANGLGGLAYLDSIVRLYYRHGAAKPFDYYVAEAVAYHLERCDGNIARPPHAVRVMSYNSKYGVTLLRAEGAAGVKGVKEQYASIVMQKPGVDAAIREADAAAVSAMAFDYSRKVGALEFAYHPVTKKLTYPA